MEYLSAKQINRDAAAAMGRPELAGSFEEPASVGNTGVTSLAVMAFLAKGHLPGRGQYGELINRGIDYVLSQQLENGLLVCHDPKGRTTGLMYEHSISTLLLGEVSGMVDPVRQQKVDDVLSRALLVLLQAQKVPKSEANTGGWRYTPGTTDSDLSLTGWSIMALRAAKLNGAAIPDEHIEMAVSYILNCHTRDGGFSYMPGSNSGSTSMTGVAVLCLELCGEHGNDDLLVAGDFILSRPPRMVGPDGNPVRFRYYAWYYCGQAMFQLGGKHWNEFAPLMYDSLLEDQTPEGSWNYPNQSLVYNTTYPTSLAILTLTVSARQLPIYQREE
ncbi:MAG: terpene cyclase/mutase family protein [Planctomycetaceae bacterium]|nr:terpene cyclase/mutase family protein [Planctomycetaceae bacterium]